MPFITGPHILRILLTWLIFYYAFNLIFQPLQISLQRKSITLIGLYFISITLNYFLKGYSYPLILLAIYFVFENHFKSNYYLINSILLNFLIKFISIILPSRLLIYLLSPAEIKTYSFTLLLLSVQFIFSFGFIYIYKLFNLNRYFNIDHSPMTSILLGYLYIVLYSSMLFMLQYRYYLNLVTGLLVFIFIQCIFIVLIFIYEEHYQKNIYQDQFTQEQVKNLKIYTDQLEHDQLQLRHFKHDYKNLLFSLKSVSIQKNSQELQEALDKLENYSDDYLNNLSMVLYKDLNNIKNSYLKSLFISKLNKMNQLHIECFFTCHSLIKDIPIETFDLIKILDNALENAINFTKEQQHGTIELAITEENQQLAFIINNSKVVLPTIDLEQDHLDKSQMKYFRKKYPNAFVQYSQNDNWFKFHITVIKGD